MSTDEYVPSEANVRAAYVLAGIPDNASSDSIKRAGRRAGPEFDRFLARVRRDAAREFVVRTLLDWGIGEDEDSDLSTATAGDLRAAVDDTYPEESP